MAWQKNIYLLVGATAAYTVELKAYVMNHKSGLLLHNLRQHRSGISKVFDPTAMYADQVDMVVCVHVVAVVHSLELQLPD